jgi:translation initiation factor IF-3
MNFIPFILRNFARQSSKPQSFKIHKKIDFEQLLIDKEFLRSIDVKVFPHTEISDLNLEAMLYDEKGNFIGQKKTSEAEELAKKMELDLMVYENDPSILQIGNFKKLVLTKVRILKNKMTRRLVKQSYRTISIRNNIAFHDLDGKLLRVKEFMEDYWNILIRIEPTETSSNQLDRSNLMALNIKKILETTPYGYTIAIKKDEKEVFIQLGPNEKREKILNSIAQDEDLFNDAQAFYQYERVKNSSEQYKLNLNKEPTQPEEIDTEAYLYELAQNIEFQIEKLKGSERNHNKVLKEVEPL